VNEFSFGVKEQFCSGV